MKRPVNTAGAHRPAPPCPPIDPSLVYPIRRLADWGFGARSTAAMQREGLRVLQYSKYKFIRGADLIAFLARGSDSESGSQGRQRPETIAGSGDVLPRTLPRGGPAR